MTDPNLNTALKWAIENSSASQTAEGGPRTQINAEALAALFAAGHQKSDADYMKESMAVIIDEGAQIENRLQAFENFEQLIENLDNANNMEPLGLWVPLVEQLKNEHTGMRIFAAWCCGTAVQNNIRTQERVSSSSRSRNTFEFLLTTSQLLIVGAIPTLVRMATEDTDQTARKKAIRALSSTVRNFQPGLDEALTHMPAEFKPQEKLDANDMDSVDVLINKLRESV